ncbi:MAG: aminodeoxychorismate/anthranilate synthase component II [Spirochaetes bacterium]|nr:aminodeoxychorismate/anthranilate synthase component II [Spirochaetota bacterium]
MYLLIDNYDSFTYNLYALFSECGAELDVVKNDVFTPADRYEGIIISPGPSSPKNSGTTLRYIREYLGRKPFFGVCLGMQSIAYSIGYGIVRARTVKHGKLDEISVTRPSVIFGGLPDSFSAVRYHSLAVDIDDRFVTSRSKNDGTVMSIEDRERKFFGVQFHPESILSDFGEKIARNFLYFTETTGQDA